MPPPSPLPQPSLLSSSVQIGNIEVLPVPSRPIVLAPLAAHDVTLVHDSPASTPRQVTGVAFRALLESVAAPARSRSPLAGVEGTGADTPTLLSPMELSPARSCSPTQLYCPSSDGVDGGTDIHDRRSHGKVITALTVQMNKPLPASPADTEDRGYR